MHLLIMTVDGDFVVVKRSDIRRIYKKNDKECFVCFYTNKNTPLTISGSPEDFFHIYLETKN